MSVTKTIKRKIFWKGPKKRKTTLSMTVNMHKAFAEIKEVTDEDMPDIICELIEDYLVKAVKQGTIDIPAGEEANWKKLIKETSEDP